MPLNLRARWSPTRGPSRIYIRPPTVVDVLPLQTSSSELGSAFFTFLILALSTGLIGAVGGAVVRRFEDPAGKYRFLYALVLLPATLGAYAFLTLAGLGPAAAAWFALEGFLADAFANFVEFLAAGLVWLTAYAPTVPSMREAHDLDPSASDLLRRMARYVLGVSAVLAVVLTPFVGVGLPLPFR